MAFDALERAFAIFIVKTGAESWRFNRRASPAAAVPVLIVTAVAASA
jgi:hypothetical protein